MSHPIRIPEGIQQCATCGEYRGRCKARDLHHGYSTEDLAGIPPRYAKAISEGSENMRPPDEKIIEVSCLCDGIVCPQCKKGRMHRPISNTYDPVRNEVWHFPHLYYLRGCDACAAKRATEIAELEAARLVEQQEKLREQRRQRRRDRLELSRRPETPWPHIERPLVGRSVHGPRLVYGETDDYRLIFLDEEEAWNRAALQRVLGLVRTWGQLADHVHPDQYAIFVRWWRGEWLPPFYGAMPNEDADDEIHRSDEDERDCPDRPRRKPRTGEPRRGTRCFDLEGYEYWLTGDEVTLEMADWLPSEVRAHAAPAWMMGEPPWIDCIRLDSMKTDEILAAFERAGYTCRQDQDLIDAAIGAA